jgi:DNA repair exonuclease SbcCD ATPase subunit
MEKKIEITCYTCADTGWLSVDGRRMPCPHCNRNNWQGEEENNTQEQALQQEAEEIYRLVVSSAFKTHAIDGIVKALRAHSFDKIPAPRAGSQGHDELWELSLKQRKEIKELRSERQQLLKQLAKIEADKKQVAARLWDLMNQEHGLILLEAELSDIMHACTSEAQEEIRKMNNEIEHLRFDKKQVAKEFTKFIGKNNWHIDEDGGVWKDAFTGWPTDKLVPFEEAWEQYLSTLNQTNP